MNKLRKFLVVGVMVLSVIAMSGFVVAPASAAASAGDLIKMEGLSSVYYLGDDGKRYVFPNESTYFSWYANFSGVVTISASELQSYPLGGNVTMRPGTKLVKITTDPSVYAVEPNGVLRKIQSEAQAAALYGTNWSKRVVDVADSFFTNYTIGTALADGQIPVGSLVKNASAAAVYYYDGTNYRSVASEAALAANRFMIGNIMTVTNTLTAGGSAITGAETALVKTSQGASTSTPVSTGSGLMVSLSSATPVSKTIPSNATRVVFTNFNVTASNDGNVVLQEITVKRTGVGAYNDISDVYIYDGAVRLSNGRSINSDTNTAEITGLNLNIPAGTTKTLSIVANIGNNKTGNHALGIESASAIVAGGSTVSGSFPVTGNTMSLSTTSVGTITIAKVGTLGNPTIGDLQASVSEFKLTAGTQDVMVQSLRLKNEGDLSTSLLSNFTLMQGTTNVSVNATVEGRYITLALNTPFQIKNGVSKNFTLKANVSSASEVGKTIKLLVDKAADVYATSDQYGYGVTPTISAFDAIGDVHSLTTLGGGVTISNLTAPASDVKTNSTGLELMKVGVKASADSIEVQQMVLTIATTKQNASSYDYGTYKDGDADATPTGNLTDDYDAGVDTILLKNIKVIDADTGATLGSSKAITDATNWADTNDVDVTLTFTYDDYFSIAKGATRNIAVVADVDSAQISNVVYKATLKFDTTSFVIKDSQDNTVTDIVPASDIAGENRTTKTSSLTLSLASTPESMTVVGGSEVDALGFIVSAGSGTGNNVKISGLTLNVWVDGVTTGSGTFVDGITGEDTVTANELVTEASLYVGGTKIAGPAAVDSNGNVVFTSDKFVGGYYEVAAGSNATVIVKAKTSGNAPIEGSTDAFAFNFLSTDLTAEDGEGNTINASGDINGTASPTTAITLTAAGTITLAADAGTPASKVIIAGLATEQELARFKLNTTKEAFDVDELTFIVSANADDDVEYLKLYDIAGTALSGNISLDANRKANFTGLTINVPKTGEKVVVVKGMIKAIGERSTATNGTAGNGADSGTTLTITTATTANDFRAVGVSSGTVDNAAEATTGSAMVIRKTIPTVSVLALPSTVLGDGTKTVAKFSVTADAAGDVAFAGLKPTYTLNDAAAAAPALSLADLKLYDVTGGNVTELTATGVATTAFLPSDSVVIIAAGTTKTFEIRGTVAGVGTGDSISVGLTKDTAALSGGTVVGTETGTGTGVNDATADAANKFVWSDQSADTSAVTSTEYTNSYVLPSWDSSLFTLSK